MPPPRLPRETSILVVDDSPAIRSRMQAYLGEMGFTRLRAASSVADALAAFRGEPADLVFLDLVIGDERGLDFAARALADRPMTDIVIMSALPPEDSQVTFAIAEGAREYLAKPFSFSGVENVLSRLANERAARARAGVKRIEDASYH